MSEALCYAKMLGIMAGFSSREAHAEEGGDSLALWRRNSTRAALAVVNDGLRYVALDGVVGHLKLVHAKAITASQPVLQQGMLPDANRVALLLEKLREDLGAPMLKIPVNVSLPARDVMLRVVDMPRMDLNEARDALQWDFDKYFPFPAAEAVYDVCALEVPGADDPGKMKVLVAAARLRMVETLLDTVTKGGFSVGGAEPILAGIFRAMIGPVPTFSSGCLMVFPEKQSTQIMVGYRSSGLLFRTLLVGFQGAGDREELVRTVGREVGSTATFVRNQFRDLSIDTILLGGEFSGEAGLAEEIRSLMPDMVVQTVSLWDLWGIATPPQKDGEWEGALGLAVGDFS